MLAPDAAPPWAALRALAERAIADRGLSFEAALARSWVDDGAPRDAMACKRCGAFSSARLCYRCQGDIFNQMCGAASRDDFARASTPEVFLALLDAHARLEAALRALVESAEAHASWFEAGEFDPALLAPARAALDGTEG